MKIPTIALFLTMFLALPALSSAQTNPVPKGYKLKKESDYKKYEQDVLKCIEWYDNTPVEKYPAIRQEVQEFLMMWHQGTPYVMIAISDLAMEGMEDNPTLLVTYMNGWSQFVIKGGDETNKTDAMIAALNHTLDTYSNPKNGFKKSKHFDKLLKAREKGQLKAMAEKEVKKLDAAKR
ncbi:hypothetical protein BH09BAC1_BH09BAC1_00540 [soil metagenome]